MSKTVVCTQNFLPYMKDDVFTVTDEEWKAIQGEQVEKGRDLKINPLIRNCIEPYDSKKQEHVDLLVAQRGKVEDSEPVQDNSAQVADLQAQLDAANAAREAAEQAKADAEAALAAKESDKPKDNPKDPKA